MTQRIPWDEYFMKFAILAAKRSTCESRSVGAVAVKNCNVMATGYNGAPKGQEHCAVTGCLRRELAVPSGERHEICRGVHAEQNVICQAALHGNALLGATIYCTTQPCSICARLIANCGIARVVYLEGYPDDMAAELLGDRLEKYVGRGLRNE